MPSPRILVGPAGRVPGWGPLAIAAGGGLMTDDPAVADALVWLDPHAVSELQETLVTGAGIRWVQLPFAGVEPFVAAGVFTEALANRPGLRFTCGKGVYAEPVAEHALALATAGLRGFPDRIRARTWGPQWGRSLFDAKVVVVGGGGITEVLLDLLAPMRCRVTVVRRNPAEPVGSMAGVEAVVGPDRLLEVLPGADLVVLAVALTPETTGMIGEAELRAMEPHAWLVNVARGPHVQTDVLVRALTEGWIGGAGLDVTDPEPLPDGHPLWDLPNVIITPHTANTFEMAQPLLAARITANVARFANDEPLIGPVDVQAGY